jgi:hypothetical protein
MGRRHYWILGLASSPHPQAKPQILILADSHAVGIARIHLTCSPDRRRSIYQWSRATLDVIVLATIACGGSQDTAKRDVTRQPVAAGCNGADSLIFSDVQASSEDEDLSGLEIVLRRRAGAWTGSSREAAGEFGAFAPLADFKADSVPGPISFSFPDERDTTVFHGQVLCDSLVGEYRGEQRMQITQASYIRIAEAGKPIPVKPARSAAAQSAGDTSGPPAAYRDSANVFDPDGYYIMNEDLTIHGRRISWLELSTIEVYYDGALHYERPKLIQPPEVGLFLSEFDDPSHHSRNLCTAPLITPDTLWVRCADTPVGEVTINGHFLDKAGRYSNKLAYENHPTVLLIARVVVTREKRVIHDAVHHFTYSAGD